MNIRSFVKEIGDFVDRRHIVRRVVLFWTLWITTIGFQEAWKFAHTATMPGVETAAILAAILTPLTGLQGFLAKFYFDGRGMNDNPKSNNTSTDPE